MTKMAQHICSVRLAEKKKCTTDVVASSNNSDRMEKKKMESAVQRTRVYIFSIFSYTNEKDTTIKRQCDIEARGPGAWDAGYTRTQESTSILCILYQFSTTISNEISFAFLPHSLLVATRHRRHCSFASCVLSRYHAGKLRWQPVRVWERKKNKICKMPRALNRRIRSQRREKHAHAAASSHSFNGTHSVDFHLGENRLISFFS